VAELVLGVPLRAPEGFGASGDIDALNVATVSALASVIAWGSLAVLERLTPRAGRVWLVGALLLLVLSLATPLSGTGVTTANRIVLLSMHLAVAAVLIPTLYRTSPDAERA